MVKSESLNKEPVLASKVVILPSFMAKHHHSYMQLVIGLSGRSEFNVNGEINLIGPGQGCVVYSHQDHAFGGIGIAEILVLNFNDFTQQHSQAMQLLEKSLKKQIFFQIDFQMQQLIRLLVAEIKANPKNMLLRQACQDTILASLATHIEKYILIKKGNRLNLNQIDRYIDQHIDLSIKTQDLAKSVFLGKSQFYIQFKTQVGMTPHQYVLHKRIEFAKNLLQSGQYNLTYIAQRCGFNSQSTFSYRFHQIEKITPNQYRKNHQSQNK